MTKVDVAFDVAAAETGVWNDNHGLRVCMKKPATIQARRWTKDDDEFLRANLGRLSETEISQRLRRTLTAVHLRWTRELHLRAPSKRDDVLTAESIAIGLNMGCSKSVHKLIDRGIMPGTRSATRDRSIRLVNRMVFMKWLMDPGHWIYVNPDRIGELRPRGRRSIPENYDFAFWEEASRMIRAARRRWKDAWLTPGKIAAMLCLPSDTRYVNAAIKRGTLPAIRWGNWWILRSAIPKGMTLNFRGEWVRGGKTIDK